MIEDSLSLLNDGGSAPESRLTDAEVGYAIYTNLLTADEGRAKDRARVRGLIDGNAPWSRSKLREAGQSWRTNVNWREAEGTIDAAKTPYYDLLVEVPRLCNLIVGGPRGDEWGEIMSDEFSKMLWAWSGFDWQMQGSQWEMVAQGKGPIVPVSDRGWHFRSIREYQVLVPEDNPSDLGAGELVCIRRTLYPAELYRAIAKADAAERKGWDVAAVRRAIEGATDRRAGESQAAGWEDIQRQIKANDLGWGQARQRAIHVCHLLWTEFPDTGKDDEKLVSHAILADSTITDKNQKDQKRSFLYRKVRKYRSFDEAIHPFLFDVGSEGTWHSVNGLGKKFFPVFEAMNRGRCLAWDAAILQNSIGFQPSDGGDVQKLNLAQIGAAWIAPPGLSVLDLKVSGRMDGLIGIMREGQQMLQSNTGTYRQAMDASFGDRPSSRRTAAEVDAAVTEMARLSKGQINRYYSQLDRFEFELAKRAFYSGLRATDPGGQAALAMRDRCMELGVPKEAFDLIERVTAGRSSGLGSISMQIQFADKLMANIYPSAGERERVLIKRRWLSAHGFSEEKDQLAPMPEQVRESTQDRIAILETADLAEGTVSPVFGTDDHVAHAKTHLIAMLQAIGTLSKGGDARRVRMFLETAGPHVGQHIQILSQDPTRADVVAYLGDNLATAGKALDKLRKEDEREQQAQEQLGPRMSAEEMEAQHKARMAEFKVGKGLELKERKQQVDISLADARTAAEIRRADAMAKAEMERAAAADEDGE